MSQDTPEYLYSEKPTIDQLKQMGWQYVQGDTQDPHITERESFKQVLLGDRLKSVIYRINSDEDGKSWLDERQIMAIASRLERLTASKLIGLSSLSCTFLVVYWLNLLNDRLY